MVFASRTIRFVVSHFISRTSRPLSSARPLVKRRFENFDYYNLQYNSSFAKMSDPALDLLSETFASSLTLNADPNQVTASILSQLPELTPEQESKQASLLALSETFPESATQLNEALNFSKFFLASEKPSLVDLITYARVRKPIVESWTPEQFKANEKLIRWADRVQKSEVLKGKQDPATLINLSVLGSGGEKKAKKEKGPKPQAKKEAAPITPAMVDLRVGFIQKAIKHPDADALYVSTIDMGDESGPRTVSSGLVKYIPLEEMQQRLIVVVANLKPVTMRGIKSEAMVLCASDDETVEFTIPPEGSKAGDKIFFEGFDGVPEAQLNPKKKIFETLQPNFTTNEQFEVVFKLEDGSVRKLVNKEGKVVKSATLVGAQVR
ncbi:uncharacterized protein V2V93DRAFT_366062 [Kockiozyma suomiensis]|uniref:uncharacterized protein n=1 Tax=Kockiozyma suomiensis TaxID=1337062 RepID=UPI003343B23D